jgi:hypothetical protein
MKVLLRRAAVTGVPLRSLPKVLANFATAVRIEHVHPLQGGLVRLRHPTERRPGLPQENPWIFWPRLIGQTITKQARVISTIAQLVLWAWRIALDPKTREYADAALTPVREDEDQFLDLLTKTTGAGPALDHLKKVHNLTHRGAATAAG